MYEERDRLGGHTATIDVEYDGKKCIIDIGLIVFNIKTYPNFNRLLDHLGVKRTQTWMGFGVSDIDDSIEYNTSNFNGFFAHRGLLLSFKHWRLLFEILHFNKQAKKIAESGVVDTSETLRTFTSKHGYSKRFLNYYLVPLTAVIWSQNKEDVLDIPFHFFLLDFLTIMAYLTNEISWIGTW